MRMPSRGFVVCLAVALGGLGVAGCTNGKDDPTPSPTTSTSISVSSSPSPSSGSPSPSPSPSVSIPAEAMQQTPEGAVAFVKFYFDQVNKAYMTPDATLLPALGESGCKSCASAQTEVLEMVSKGQRYSDSVISLSDVSAQAGASAGQQFVALTMNQLAVTKVDTTGGVVDTNTARSAELKALVSWKEGSWVMSGVG